MTLYITKKFQTDAVQIFNFFKIILSPGFSEIISWTHWSLFHFFEIILENL